MSVRQPRVVTPPSGCAAGPAVQGGAPPPLGGEPTGGQLRLANLLNDLSQLSDLLTEEVRECRWLDAFLLAAGIVQVLEDDLHEPPLMLRKIVRRLRSGGGGGTLAATPLSWADGALWAPLATARERSALGRCRDEGARLVSALAPAVARAGPPQGGAGAARNATERLSRLIEALPRAERRGLVRIPACFNGLDLSPRDVVRLAREAVAGEPDPRRPVLAIGIRTSGSYLAPLAAATLRAAGRPAGWMTMRPGQGWLAGERRRLRQARRAGWLVLLLDDPPRTWRSIREALEDLRVGGLDPRAVTLTLPTLISTMPPPADLVDHPAVLLPWERWEVRQRLRPASIERNLAELLGGRARAVAVARRPFAPQATGRGHASGLYQVSITWMDGLVETCPVLAQGVGIGYFGAHSAEVADRLRGRVPEVYGVREGLLFREWLGEESRLGGVPSRDLAAAISDYVDARAAALPLANDPSRRLRGRPSAQRWVGRFLAEASGRTSIAVGPLAEAAVRALGRAQRPSVVDGRTAPGNWFLAHDGRAAALKVGFSGGAYSSVDAYCFDPVFDLAGAAAAEPEELGRELRRMRAERGQPISPERWLLHQLAHLLVRRSQLRDGGGAGAHSPEVERGMARLFQRYASEVLLPGAGESDPRGERGDLCAIDLDGVLETSFSGVAVIGREGARALRALSCHGYRPVLASGRSLGEVRERSRAYGLAGGVAEYGAAVYVRATDSARERIGLDEQALLAALRERLELLTGVLVDPAYQYSVRAYRVDSAGRRRGLEPAEVELALAGWDGEPRPRIVPGEAQTDFVVASATKEGGLATLAGELGAPAGRLALAVGDSLADLGMLRQARLGLAPANASPRLRAAGVQVLGRPFQAGLEQAVARLLGHRPGGCPICREPRLTRESRVVLTLLNTSSRRMAPSRLLARAAAMARVAYWTWRIDRAGRGEASPSIRA
jgi:hypothetical protein